MSIMTRDLVLLESIGVLNIWLLAARWTGLVYSAVASLLMRRVLRRYVVSDVVHDGTLGVQHESAKAAAALFYHGGSVAGFLLWWDFFL